MSNALVVEHHGQNIVIRFNRPEIRNPLSVIVVDELQSVLESVSRTCERIIFTGSGSVFASGADLREIAAVSSLEARAFALRGQKLMTTIADCRAVTTAAVNGYCFGGALDLALSCRRRIAAPNATFSHPGADLGIITGWSGTQRLPRLVGESAALEMFFTAEPLTSSEALRIGLIDRVELDPLSYSLTNF